MLINFKFKNCRSFFDETNLSMEATSDKTFDTINTFSIKEGLNEKNNELIKTAVIFGSNASGKSNVLKALNFMKEVVIKSAAQFPITDFNETFAFLENADKLESLYEVELISNSIYYKYGFTIKDKIVEKEWLYRRNERITKVFSRNANHLEIINQDKSATKLINISKKSLFLSIGNNFNLNIKDDLNNVLSWFISLVLVFENNANSFDIYSMENNKYKQQALEILELADIGIKDIDVKKDKLASVNSINDILKLNMQMQINPATMQGQIKQEATNLYNIDLKTQFHIFDKEGNKTGNRNVFLLKDAGFNSEGTMKLLFYLGWILAALDQGRVIVIDEIDSKLHFLVVDYLLKLFNSINRNPKNAQLICTAHNIMIMDDNLRRDQIYFTCKDKYGKSNLLSLSDFSNVRKTDLFSKKYLAGFYASLPNMDREL